jgi:protein-S-isoprenylcysteine O-methyltransferase Ste14
MIDSRRKRKGKKEGRLEKGCAFQYLAGRLLYYVFGTLAFLFVVLALQGWPALIIWLVVILIQVGRARREEAVLSEMFGAEYSAYRSRTWF